MCTSNCAPSSQLVMNHYLDVVSSSSSTILENIDPTQSAIDNILSTAVIYDQTDIYRSEMINFNALPGFSDPSASHRPRDAQGGIQALNLAVYNAMKKADVPAPNISVLTQTNDESFPKLGSDQWYQQAQTSGVYIPLPTDIDHLFIHTTLKGDKFLRDFLSTYRTEAKAAQTEGITLALTDYKELYKSQRGRSNDKGKRLFQKDGMGNHEVHTFRALCTFVDAIIEINQHMNRLAANGASQDQLAWIARKITTPTAAISPGSEVDDHHFGDFMKTLGKEQEIFSIVYHTIQTNPGNAKLFDEFKGSASQVAANLLAERGTTQLQKQADELNLEFFEDSEQYKVDINLAIIQTSKSLQRDIMNWSHQERIDFNTYINDLRSAAFSHPQQVLDQLDERYTVKTI
ncbi:MAG: hypothetical protein KTR25_15825 [Myxococcales bacterium]|nr:hypothetical protein [Myxococcales bacterium]